ncbi:MAG: hypothetical protein QOG64_947 [Acidimicrobiaceae bacterium]|nr:hypothetical protein [Acidimicrobiaceae bacterium]
MATGLAPSPTRSRLRWWKEAIYIGAFYLVYSVVRNLQGSATRARHNALHIIRLEKLLGIYQEHGVQHIFGLTPGADIRHLHWRTFIQFWDVYYGSAHFIVSIVALVWLFRRDKARYPLWRNTLAITTGLALIGFATFPLMPPRLLPEYGFIDTLKSVGGLWNFDSGAMSKVSNQYAAMPSLHFGWSSWCACVFWPSLRRPWTKVLAVAYPFLTLFAIVVTANHFILDAAGGAAVFGVAYLLARAFTGWVSARTT